MADTLPPTWSTPASADGSPDGEDAVEALGTAGFVAKGVLYLLLGVLAAPVAFGLGGGGASGTSRRGALRALAGEPFGQVVLVALAVGLAGYALLRLVHAFTNPSGEDGAKGVAMRASYLLRAGAYGLLCASALQLVLGGGGGGGGSRQQATATVLSWPFGSWLVGLAGLVVIGVGAYQLKRGLTREFTSQITAATGRVRDVVERAGVVGLTARGVVFGLIGWFLVQAALTRNPSEAGGLDRALQEVASAPWGTWLLLAMAIGLAAYGVFQLAMARYGTARTAG